MEEYVKRMMEAGIQEETAKDVALDFLNRGDLEGLKQYVTACEVLAGVC